MDPGFSQTNKQTNKQTCTIMAYQLEELATFRLSETKPCTEGLIFVENLATFADQGIERAASLQDAERLTCQTRHM